MAKGMKAIVAMAALSVGLLGAAGVARADATDGNYTFNYASTTGGPTTSSGVFTLSGVNITSVNGSFADSGGRSGAVAFPLDGTSGSEIFSIGNSYFISASFYSSSNTASFLDRANYYGILSNNNNVFSGNIRVANIANGNEGSGLFTATLENFLNPVSPGSGGSTGGSGGTGTGSSGATGAAPSPEVNTLFGFLVVGGTVAFLKRRRRGAGAEGMAVA